MYFTTVELGRVANSMADGLAGGIRPTHESQAGKSSVNVQTHTGILITKFSCIILTYF